MNLFRSIFTGDLIQRLKHNVSMRNIFYLKVDLDGYSQYGVSLVAQLVKNLPAMQETPVRFLGQKDSLVKG